MFVNTRKAISSNNLQELKKWYFPWLAYVAHGSGLLVIKQLMTLLVSHPL